MAFIAQGTRRVVCNETKLESVTLGGPRRRQCRSHASIHRKGAVIKTSSWVDRVLSTLDLILQIAAVVLLAITALAVTAQVLARYVVSTSTPWTVELASYSFVWLSMIGIALGLRRGRHMVLDIWEYLPYRRWLVVVLDTIAALIVVLVLLVLVWYGFQAAGPALRRTMPGLGLPYAYVSLAVPVGSIIALVFALEAWWKGVHAPRGVEPLPQKLLYQPADEVVIKGEI